jgi:hypothetical protein
MTKAIWKLSNDKSVRYFAKRAYCCIVAILIMTCVLLYKDYLFLNCMGSAVILAQVINNPSERRNCVYIPNSETLLSKMDGVKSPCIINLKTSDTFLH